MVYKQFPGIRGERQGGVLDGFELVFGEFSVNFPDEILIKINRKFHYSNTLNRSAGVIIFVGVGRSWWWFLWSWCWFGDPGGGFLNLSSSSGSPLLPLALRPPTGPPKPPAGPPKPPPKPPPGTSPPYHSRG